MKVLGLLLVVAGLVGCQKAPEPAPAPMWYLESYDAARGFTFSKDMLVHYVATCESFKPTRVLFEKDPTTGKVGVAHGDCTGLLPLVGTLENISGNLTITDNHLLLSTRDGEYSFKIVSVHGIMSSLNDCPEKPDGH